MTQLVQKIPEESVKKRNKTLKMEVSQDEKELILKKTTELGYSKPRDLLLAIAHGEVKDPVLIENENRRLKNGIRTLGTEINKIYSGIDVENSKNDLVRKTRKLCVDCKL